MPIDKDFYNESSAANLGWDPTWFGEKYFDDQLVRAVKKWQRAKGLTADGLVGPMTFRRVWTEREANIDEHKPQSPTYSNYIVHNGNFIPIKWDKVVLWSQTGGLKANKGTYYNYTGRPPRKIKTFVNHWDVCLNSHSCQVVLNRRGISVHFLIDNDGTIFQMLDTQHKAWHAGISNYEGGNTKGVGVEISNAYSLKYQDWYVQQGFGERPVQENGWVHGKKLDPFLDFYPVQIDALKALWKAVHAGIGISLEYPKNSQGLHDTSVNKECERGRFNGICNHYNFTKNKIDCAGLDIPTLIEQVKQTPIYCLDR